MPLKREHIFGVAIFVLAAVCGVLAVLQYRWIGEVAAAEQQRLQQELQRNVNLVRRDFNSQVAEAFLALVSSLNVLDVMLPKKNGFDVCKELRQAGVDTAILMLTAKTLVGDRVAGLRLGADDYLAKPFDPAELLARIEALLRRVEKRRRLPLASFSFEDVSIDFERAEVSRAGQRISLAAKEFQLLEYLITHRDRILPREEILQKVWQYDGEVNSRTVDVHIAWLRQKLDTPQNPQHIQTVRGRGYNFSS